MKENLKVSAAAVLGVFAPATNWFFTAAEPMLRLFLLVCQIGVAGATLVYIVAKIRKLRKLPKK